MRKLTAFLPTLLISLCVTQSATWGADEIVIEDAYRGIPVQTAVLTRRYGAVETEDEVAAQELEAGEGVTNTFKLVHWYRYGRPYGWYGYYGPRYYVGYRPRFAYSAYPYYGAYWGGYYGPTPYAAFYAPQVYAPSYYAPSYYAPPIYYGRWGGCCYW